VKALADAAAAMKEEEELRASASPQLTPKLEVLYRVGFIVVLMFVGYKMALACSRNVFLQDYMASLQPSLVVVNSTPPVSNSHLQTHSHTFPVEKKRKEQTNH
jgi:hypothetical protein